jgi:hypothetical protein
MRGFLLSPTPVECSDGSNHNLELFDDRPLWDMLQIHSHAVIKVGNLIASADLAEASNTGSNHRFFCQSLERSYF